MEVKQIQQINQIDASDWNSVSGFAYPFVRHEFLSALELSGTVSEQTGWQPRHLLVFEQTELVAALPLYLKRHSRGEYVFDQQWAAAYHQRNQDYYPKLITAIPFTPCQGPRLLLKSGMDAPAILASLLAHIQQDAGQNGISSWHCLFPAQQTLQLCRNLGLIVREAVQYQWFNQNYRSFDEYLQTFNAGKRKMLKRERRRIGEQGISLLRVPGLEITDQQWQVFYKFYAMTYFKRQSLPYLNPEFFQQIAANMPEQILLVLAMKENDYVGAALSFVGEDCLYGRFWGCYEAFNALHFEACYYQGLEYCIEHGLQRFDSGAQGEHKISRGFQPVTTYSAHWIKDPGFSRAISQFVEREKSYVASYKQDAAAYLPFKRL